MKMEGGDESPGIHKIFGIQMNLNLSGMSSPDQRFSQNTNDESMFWKNNYEVSKYYYYVMPLVLRCIIEVSKYYYYVYSECLKLIPHKKFSFCKYQQLNLSGARAVLRNAIGIAPKDKKYIKIELQLGNMDHCRKLYEEYLEWSRENFYAWSKYAELERSLMETARPIFELAIAQPALDMPALFEFTNLTCHGLLSDNPLFHVQVLKYWGVANVVAETAWMRNLLRELHTPLLTATLVYCDNVILHVPSRYQYTDIFTKGLPSTLFEEFRTSLSVRLPPAQTAREFFSVGNVMPQVPKVWDKLLVSIIYVETGKTIARSTKALVRNRTCQLAETLSESIWISYYDSSKELEEHLFKFVVSMGSARSGILGEATVNFARYYTSSRSFGFIAVEEMQLWDSFTGVEGPKYSGSDPEEEAADEDYDDAGSQSLITKVEAMFEPSIQKRRLSYVKHEHLVLDILKHLQEHSAEKILTEDGLANLPAIKGSREIVSGDVEIPQDRFRGFRILLNLRIQVQIFKRKFKELKAILSLRCVADWATCQKGAEKNELLDEKLEQQVKHIECATYLHGSCTCNPCCICCCPLPSMQFMPPAAVDTSQDQVVHPPVA
ncbi:crooked neck-like protein 1 [Tanacetum coccineum]